MENLNVQHPLLQSSVSHDLSEIILKCQFGESLVLVLSMLQMVVLIIVVAEQ